MRRIHQHPTSPSIHIVFFHGAAHEFHAFASLVASGRFTAERDVVAELCDGVAGKKRGRESADDIMLYESPGMGILDVGIGNWVYGRARKLGLGVEMPFGVEEHET